MDIRYVSLGRYNGERFMNIQDNCADIPKKPTESNFGLLLSKQYRAKIAERYNNFFL